MTSSIDTIQNVKNRIASEVSKIRRSPPDGVQILREESDATDNSVSPHLFKNLFELLDDVYDGIPPEPDEDGLLQPIAHCFAVIDAPDGTPYEGGHFRIRIDFFETYPDKPPRVFFLTPIFHPNVKQSGEILPAAMEKDWDSRSRVRDLFKKVNVLFVQYDPAMAWNERSQKLLLSHVEDFAAASKAFTEMFAVYDPRTGPKKSQEEDDEPLEFMTDDDGKLIRRSEQSKGSTRNSVRSVNESAPMSKLDEFLTDDNGKLIRTQRSSQSNGNPRDSMCSVDEPSSMSMIDEDDEPGGAGSANRTNPENNANTARVAPPSKITSTFKYLFGASAATAAAAAVYYSYYYGDGGD